VVFQHQEEANHAEQWCFSIGVNDKGLLTRVFQQQKEAKQLLDGIVSSMMAGKKNERLLIMVFQQQEEKKSRNKCWTELFWK
jgi:hypothetical protein